MITIVRVFLSSKPFSCVELVEAMASARWRLRRLANIETTLLTNEMETTVDDLAHRVVSEATVEHLDKVGGGEETNAQAGTHGGGARTGPSGSKRT